MNPFLQRLIEQLLGGANQPPVPPAPTQILTGMGPAADRATNLMPPEHQQALRKLLEQKKAGLSFMEPGQEFTHRGTFNQGNRQLLMNKEMLRMPEQDIAETLTHETQHSLQNQPNGFLQLLMQRFGTKPSYEENPYEKEAFAAQKLVKRGPR